MIELAQSWLLYPAVLGLLCLGIGLVVDLIGGRRTSSALLIPLGLAALIVLSQIFLLSPQLAHLSPALFGGLAVFGLIVNDRWRRIRSHRIEAILAAAVMLIFALPFLLIGTATFAGYIKLDDTATWMAFADQLLANGNDFSGLAPSSFEATVALNLGLGYPVAAFLPWGASSALSGIDVAWTVQPFMAFAGVCMALSLFELARKSGRIGPRGAALAALAASGSSLLYGYYLWGGYKELLLVALLALIAASSAVLFTDRPRRELLIPAVAISALFSLFNVGAIPWLFGIGLVALALCLIGADRKRLLIRLGIVSAAAVTITLPYLLQGSLIDPTSSTWRSTEELGNLIGPLNPLQAAGVWLASDFRVSPGLPLVSFPLIFLVLACAAWGIRRSLKQPPLMIYSLGSLLGATVLVIFGSPWIDGKTLAALSPMSLFVAAIGIRAIWRRRAVAGGLIGGLLGVALVIGVGWQILGSSYAPRAQLAELERIGEQISGFGPTLMTEYQPYGVRHFLRDSDPEGASELRRRLVELRNGKTVEDGGYTDTDQISPSALGDYRTLVLRRSPAQSRPPLPFEMIDETDHYTVWQRPSDQAVVDYLPLGTAISPAAPISCDRLLSYLKQVGGSAIAIPRQEPILIPIYGAAVRDGYAIVKDGDVLNGELTVSEPSQGRLWLGGSISGELRVYVDGNYVSTVKHAINNYGQYVDLGELNLDPGTHSIELHYSEPPLQPGSLWPKTGLAPLLFAVDDINAEPITLDAHSIRRDCDPQQAYDWIAPAG